jgi:hypothetical protein
MMPLRSSARTRIAAGDRDIGLDLDRIVWDPEYRREVIDRLASTESESGTADKPD